MLEIKLALLKQFQQKACCIHSYYKANHIWKRLEPFLIESERISLLIELDHWRIGEGREAFDDICNKILNKEEITFP